MSAVLECVVCMSTIVECVVCIGTVFFSYVFIQFYKYPFTSSESTRVRKI